jgi:hypothetical protein
VSARSFIARVAVSAGYSHESAELLVQRALDEHAHELAEKQRAFRDKQYGPLEFKAEKKALNGAIDLIDPEVEK